MSVIGATVVTTRNFPLVDALPDEQAAALIALISSARTVRFIDASMATSQPLAYRLDARCCN
jgi:hypothetical protein